MTTSALLKALLCLTVEKVFHWIIEVNLLHPVSLHILLCNLCFGRSKFSQLTFNAKSTVRQKENFLYAEISWYGSETTEHSQQGKWIWSARDISSKWIDRDKIYLIAVGDIVLALSFIFLFSQPLILLPQITHSLSTTMMYVQKSCYSHRVSILSHC